MYFVYILECKDGSLYTGISNDVLRRFQMHKEGKGGHYTRAKGVKKILFTEECKDKSAALKREMAIKRLSRKKKIDLLMSSGKGILK